MRARKHGIGDLVTIQMQNRKDTSVTRGVEKLVAVPSGGERTGFGFAVSDNAADDEIGIVEGCSISMAQRIAELAAFVDAAGSFGRDVAGNSAGEAELLKQLLHPLCVLADIGIILAVCTFKVSVRNQRRPAVAGADDIDHFKIVALNHPVEMNVQHVQPGGSAPVAEQTCLDVLAFERFFEKWIIEKVNLTYRKII